MLNAHLPQPLGSSVVRKLKANCTFKLLILEERQDRETEIWGTENSVHKVITIMKFVHGCLLIGIKGADQDRRTVWNVQPLGGRVWKAISRLCIYTLSPFGHGCSCRNSVKGGLYLAQPQDHCVALSPDWAVLRHHNITKRSMEDKLHSTMTRTKIIMSCRSANLLVSRI